MEGMQIVVFSLNDEICGVDTSQVKEIVKYEEVSKMPECLDLLTELLILGKSGSGC